MAERFTACFVATMILFCPMVKKMNVFMLIADTPNEVEVTSGSTSELVASDRSLAQGSDEQENPLGEYPLWGQWPLEEYLHKR